MDNVTIGSKIDSTRQSYSVEHVTLILTSAQTETGDIFLPLGASLHRLPRVGNRRLLNTGFQFCVNGDPEKVIPGKWFLFIGEENREPGCTVKGHKGR